MAREDMIREEAVAWAVRTGEADFDDWDAFTTWLEADPAHAAEYDKVVAAAGEGAEALLRVPRADNDDIDVWPVEVPRIQRRRFLAGAMAAALAGLAVLGVWQQRDPRYGIETGPGETRIVELEGGVQIALAGDTRLVLDREDGRFASLDRGQALFTVEHDPAAPYRVIVGEDTLLDIGTVFDVRRTAGGLEVAVSEGEVLFNPERQAARILPGQRLTSRAGSDEYAISAIPSAEVGEWLQGRLTFRDATLEQVAADLSAATGSRFSVAPRARGRIVSGSLMLDRVKADPRAVGPLLGVTIRFEAGAWELGNP